MKWLGNYILEWLRGPWPELYFVRHGHGFHQLGYEIVEQGKAKSPLEALGVDIPNHLMPLTPLGRWQAEQTGKLINIEPDCIYASQIQRAIETAQIVFPDRLIKIDPRLNEKEFGASHMLGKEDLQRYFPYQLVRYQRDGKYFASKAPDGENYIDLFIRLHSFLDTLRRDWAGKTVYIFCHSAVTTAIRQLFEHYDPETLMKVAEEEWIENCGLLHYRRAKGLYGWKDGKFRLELDQPPYKLWQLDSMIEEQLQQKALAELEELRKKFK